VVCCFLLRQNGLQLVVLAKIKIINHLSKIKTTLLTFGLGLLPTG
jgi:hypothetical protein